MNTTRGSVGYANQAKLDDFAGGINLSRHTRSGVPVMLFGSIDPAESTDLV